MQTQGTQAALICGFACTESWAIEMWNTQYTPWWLITCYYVTNIVSLICTMYCVMNATLVSVLGPTFALNGPRGSMQESVKAMKEEVGEAHPDYKDKAATQTHPPLLSALTSLPPLSLELPLSASVRSSRYGSLPLSRRLFL